MSKIIFVGDSQIDIEFVKTFAQNNKYEVEYYSNEEWDKQIHNKILPQSNDHRNELQTTDNMIHFSSVKNTVFNSMEDMKIDAIKKALIISNGNASKAAGMLKIGRATLYRKIKQLDFDLEALRKISAEQNSRSVLKKSA